MNRFSFCWNKPLLALSTLAFGVFSLAAILFFFAVDANAFAFDDSAAFQDANRDF